MRERNNMENKKYTPSYTSVGREKIHESANIPLDTREGGYFAEENCRIQFFRSSIYITDLSNGMKTGKECNKKVFYTNNQNFGNLNEMRVTLNNQGFETFTDLLQAKSIPDFEMERKTVKGVRTFSPFVEVKPIKEPQKWTASHLAKAILSGQVFHGVSEGHYTDDYARDSERNFGRGGTVNLEEVARDLIEDRSSGLWFRHEVLDSGITEIGISTYSYDYKKFSFDVNCTHELKAERLQTMEQSLGEINSALLEQNKKIDVFEIATDVIYDVKYLEEDSNTGLYEEKSRWMYPEELRCLAEIDFEIVGALPIEIADETLYQIGTLQKPVPENDLEDSRFIGAGGGKIVITGLALKELMMEERQFPVLQVCHPDNIADMKEELEKMVDGTRWFFSDRGEFDAERSLEKLEQEEIRLENGITMGGMT